MNYTHLAGRRYVNLVRCSTDQQADTSPEDQQRVLHQFARENGMVHAGGDIVLAGVSGSRPGARTDISELVVRKHERNDYDVLLVQDISRLSRGGSDHIGKIKFDLGAAGVEVVFATGATTGDADQDGLIHSIGAYAAQQQMKSMSYAVVRGQMSSLAAGNIPHAYRVPFGVDRLYVGPGGRARHRIRNLTDGSQQMLAVDTDDVLAHYPPNSKQGEPVHYRRQSDEKVVLIPGAPDAVAIVRQIYRRTLLNGWGRYRIAMELNTAGAKSPDGGLWGIRSIKIVLENATYTGQGIASRTSTGMYYGRGVEAAPEAVKRDVKALSTRKSAGRVPRPEAYWTKQDLPTLANFLGDELAERARDYHATVLSAAAKKALQPQLKGKPGGDKHVDSTYVLKGLLHTTQGGHAMTGKTCGPKGRRHRYYAATRGASVPIAGSILSKLIPAGPLERAVLAAVHGILMDDVSLEKSIRSHFDRQVSERQPPSDTDVNELKRDRDEIAQRLTDAMLLGAASRKLMQKRFDQWEAELAALESRTVAVETASSALPVNTDGVVEAVLKKIRGVADSLDGLPLAGVRGLLQTLVARLEVDLETKAVQMELALPEAIVMLGGKVNAKPLCLNGISSQKGANEAQRLKSLKIAVFDCDNTTLARNKTSCYVCTRRAA